MGSEGWTFEAGPGTIPDSVNGAAKLHEVYTTAKPDYSGRVTVPVLWDKLRRTIVSNESAEIVRMFNSAFDPITGYSLDFFPKLLRGGIETLTEEIYLTVNNCVSTP